MVGLFLGTFGKVEFIVIVMSGTGQSQQPVSMTVLSSVTSFDDIIYYITDT
jgi:hypothetical protein